MSAGTERWAALDSKYERLVDITCPQPVIDGPRGTRRRWHYRITGTAPGHRGRLVRHGLRRAGRSL